MENSSFNKLFTLMPNNFEKSDNEINIPNYSFNTDYNFFDDNAQFKKIINKINISFQNQKLSFEKVKCHIYNTF